MPLPRLKLYLENTTPGGFQAWLHKNTDYLPERFHGRWARRTPTWSLEVPPPEHPRWFLLTCGTDQIPFSGTDQIRLETTFIDHRTEVALTWHGAEAKDLLAYLLGEMKLAWPELKPAIAQATAELEATGRDSAKCAPTRLVTVELDADSETVAPLIERFLDKECANWTGAFGEGQLLRKPGVTTSVYEDRGIICVGGTCEDWRDSPAWRLWPRPLLVVYPDIVVRAELVPGSANESSSTLAIGYLQFEKLADKRWEAEVVSAPRPCAIELVRRVADYLSQKYPMPVPVGSGKPTGPKHTDPPIPARLYVDDIDSFAKVRHVDPAAVSHLLQPGGYLAVCEETVQTGLEKILSEPRHKKDWGGENNDLYTCNLVVDGARKATAFLLKGSGLQASTLELKHCGKNGDQVLRLFDSPAELFVVQFVGSVSEAVIRDVEGKVAQLRAKGMQAQYCVIDGQDTARLLHAYGLL